MPMEVPVPEVLFVTVILVCILDLVKVVHTHMNTVLLLMLKITHRVQRSIWPNNPIPESFIHYVITLSGGSPSPSTTRKGTSICWVLYVLGLVP